MKKTLAMILAVVLLMTACVAGTIAWLTDTTDPVTNTFTVGNIDITLEESENLNLKMVPGSTITKDPEVSVLANSEACWLFVKVEKSDNFDDFMTFDMANGWNPLAGNDGVYYREVAASDAAQDFAVLKNDEVTVKESVTKSMMDDITNQTASAPTLSFTAYAVQKANVTSAADAWAKANA